MPIKEFEKRIYLKFDMQPVIERLVKDKSKQMRARLAKIGGIYEITPGQIKEEAELEENQNLDASSQPGSPTNKNSAPNQ